MADEQFGNALLSCPASTRKLLTGFLFVWAQMFVLVSVSASVT